MALAWPALELLAELFLAIALALMRVVIVGAAFAVLIDAAGHIPYVGGWLSGSLTKVNQQISHALGEWESKIDQALGNSFHRLATAMNSLWDEFKRHAKLLGLISPMLAEAVYLLTHLRHQVRSQDKQIKQLGTRAHKLEQGAAGSTKAHLPARVGKLEKEYHGIEQGIKHITRELHGIDDVKIPSLRHAVNEADSVATQALAAANAIPFPTSANTWAEAIALAFPALGMNWVRCNPLGRLFNSRGCGVGNLLEDLFGGIFDVFLLSDFCALLPEAEKLFGDLAGPAIGLISSAANSVCAIDRQGKVYPDVPVPASTLPPAQALGSLP
jgi:hypothetical protein